MGIYTHLALPRKINTSMAEHLCDAFSMTYLIRLICIFQTHNLGIMGIISMLRHDPAIHPLFLNTI